MRYDLKDTTFLIYLRIDSFDRLLNLNIAIGHIVKHFNTNIHLLEVDYSKNIKNQIINRESLTYVFAKNRDLIVHNTKYRNLMIRPCETPYFYEGDIDFITAPEFLLKVYTSIKKKDA